MAPGEPRAPPPSTRPAVTASIHSLLTTCRIVETFRTQRLSSDRTKSSAALKEWGASEGPDLGVRCSSLFTSQTSQLRPCESHEPGHPRQDEPTLRLRLIGRDGVRPARRQLPVRGALGGTFSCGNADQSVNSLTFKSIRTKEEHLASLKRSKDSLASKIDGQERKVSKMKEENKVSLLTSSEGLSWRWWEVRVDEARPPRLVWSSASRSYGAERGADAT